MALTDIYVLPQDYPTFDWADWPASKAACVSGGYTHEFEKECWNAIIDLLAAALTDAGLSWDSLYTPASVAKITESMGDLYAAAFNSVRHNIDHPMPIGWQWAKNPIFRGYVGREDFRGVDIWGEKQADDVYAEYIPELVRKMNLLIEVMKGDKATLLSMRSLSQSLSDTTARAIPSLPISGIRSLSSTSSDITVRAGLSAPIVAESLSHTKSKLEVQTLQAARVRGESLSKTLNSVKAYSRRAAVVAPKPSISKTLSSVLVLSGIPIELVITALSKTKSSAEVRSMQSCPIAVQGLSASKSNVEVRSIESYPISIEGVSKTKSATTITPGDSAPISVRSKSATKSAVAVQAAPAPAVVGQSLSKTISVCRLSTAWYPPIWVNGGFWIRQSHSVTQNENGELVIT